MQANILRALGLLKCTKQYFLLATLNDFYKGIVEPTFSYRCSVWGSCGTAKLNRLQELQNGAAKIVKNSAFDSFEASLIK